MPGPYSPTGSFVNGNAPGISATFLNNLEAYIAWAEGDASAQVSVSGTTAGTAVLYQFLQGGLKGFLLYFNGYRNSTATEQYLTLPVAFTAYGVWQSGGIPQTHIATGTTNINGKVNVMTGLPAGSGAGAISVQNQFNGYS